MYLTGSTMRIHSTPGVGGSAPAPSKPTVARKRSTLSGRCAWRGTTNRASETKANQAPKADPMSKESIMADFQCCDQEQACELLIDIAEKKAFPVDPYKLQEMRDPAMRNMLSVLLDMPDAKGGAK